MTVSFGFYNSSNGDRKYDAVDMAGMFDAILEDGVHKNFGSEFSVRTVSGLNLIMGTGRSWTRKTWTLNDTDFAFTAQAANAANPRIDAWVLEVNSDPAVRSNVFRWVTGIAAATPTRPVLTVTSTVRQYPIAWVLRRANVASVAASDISYPVGTSDFPYAVSRLLDRAVEPSVMHRNVFRGKNLGGAITAAQSAAIASGTFEDLYIGDYWSIGGRNWRIADFNYFLGKGFPVNTTPHLVVIPDTNLAMAQWNNGTVIGSAYVGSSLRGTTMPNTVMPIVDSALGSSHILPVRTILVNAINGDGSPSGIGWYNERGQVPTGHMFFGSTYYRTEAQDAFYQLPLFHLAPQFLKAADNQDTWLRDTTKGNSAATFNQSGGASTSDAIVTNTLGVRPVLAVI